MWQHRIKTLKEREHSGGERQYSMGKDRNKKKKWKEHRKFILQLTIQKGKKKKVDQNRNQIARKLSRLVAIWEKIPSDDTYYSL